MSPEPRLMFPTIITPFVVTSSNSSRSFIVQLDRNRLFDGTFMERDDSSVATSTNSLLLVPPINLADEGFNGCKQVYNFVIKPPKYHAVTEATTPFDFVTVKVFLWTIESLLFTLRDDVF